MKVTKTFSFNKKADKDILDFLNMTRNQSEYIRKLIREDMQKDKNKNELMQIKKILREVLNKQDTTKQTNKHIEQQEESKFNKKSNINNLDVVDVNQIYKLI